MGRCVNKNGALLEHKEYRKSFKSHARTFLDGLLQGLLLWENVPMLDFASYYMTRIQPL